MCITEPLRCFEIVGIHLQGLLIIHNRFLVLSGHRIRVPAPRIFWLVVAFVHLGIHRVKYDGKDCLVTGAPWDTVALKQVDANTLTFTVRQASGKFHATGRTVVSKDGKVMTTTGSGTDADGKAISVTLVYDKQ